MPPFGDAMKRAIIPLSVTAILLICGCMESATVDIPDEYYFQMKKADVDSPVELIRFASSVRPYTTGFTITEKVAFLNGT